MEKDRKLGLAIVIGGAATTILGAIYYWKSANKSLGLGDIVGKTYANGMTVTHHQGRMPIKERAALIQNMVWEGVKNPEMRKLALQITSNCPARDGLCEAKAIYDWTRTNIRYTGDIAPVKLGPLGPVEAIDLYQAPNRTVEFGGGDCLPTGTLLLTSDYKFVPIEDLVKGTKIWGRDAWTTVEDVWAKGILPIDVVFLNNGSSFKATPDHKVYVALCPQHQNAKDPCACPISARVIERLTVSQLKEDMVLVQPKQVEYGAIAQDPDLAYLDGLYLSDGWSDRPTEFRISGQDGQPKEAQKREVENICAKLNISTTWQRKHIAVLDRQLTDRMRQMGKYAPEKHALSINLDKAAVSELLRGILADSGKNTNCNANAGFDGRTFTSTSRELMLQTRVMLRMMGLSCGERYIVDHGGLGENPVWRLQVRTPSELRARGNEKLLRVKAIERDVLSLPTYDLKTSDHYVYLPEADVVVSNCDDHAALNSTLLALNGIPNKLRITSTSRSSNSWSHIFNLFGLNKQSPSQWVPLDTTLPGDYFGREIKFTQHIDFDA